MPELACLRAWEVAAGLLRRPSSAEIQGQPAALEDAATLAARLIEKSGYPLVAVSGSLSVDEIQAALRLAERARCTVSLPAAAASQAVAAASLQAGILQATLGELAGSLDRVLLLGTATLASHPRLWNRLGPGAERTVLALAEPAGDLHRLRAVFAGIEPGSPQENSLLQSLAQTGQGIAVFGEDLAGLGSRAVEELLRLLTELGQGRRWLALFLAEAPNAAAAAEILPSLPAYPGRLHDGHPTNHSWPMLHTQDASPDLVISAGEACPPSLRLKSGNVIQIGGAAAKEPPAVYIPACLAGWSAPGFALRCDSLPLKLAAPVSEPFPTITQVIDTLAEYLT